MKETTPSECIPSVFNAARQLLILVHFYFVIFIYFCIQNPDESDLPVATIMYAPTWIIERVDNGDELEDKHIGEQLFHLLKVISDSPAFAPKT